MVADSSGLSIWLLLGVESKVLQSQDTLGYKLRGAEVRCIVRAREPRLRGT